MASNTMMYLLRQFDLNSMQCVSLYGCLCSVCGWKCVFVPLCVFGHNHCCEAGSAGWHQAPQGWAESWNRRHCLAESPSPSRSRLFSQWAVTYGQIHPPQHWHTKHRWHPSLLHSPHIWKTLMHTQTNKQLCLLQHLAFLAFALKSLLHWVSTSAKEQKQCVISYSSQWCAAR